MAKETHSFQAEVKEILNLMVHSLYSKREVFLRELISNASDALDKLRVASRTHPEWDIDTSQGEIRLIPDSQNNSLTIMDNGIGMSRDEVLENIGTIAHSGSKEFLEKFKELKENPELIGQFGVGFYSAFMVADKITLHTQKAGENTGTLWESSGDGTFTINEVARPEGHGTAVTLHLPQPDSEDDSSQDFTQEWVLKSLVKKYSDFIPHPIRMKVTRTEKDEEGNDKQVTEDETLNSQKALWLRSPNEITEEEYNEFYKHVTHDWSDPLKTIHFHVEGMQEFSGLLYIPSQIPFNYFTPDNNYGLQLYVRRVFVMDDCNEIVPSYLRFLKGVVDSSDLSLNVSREILQQDRQVEAIKKALTNKVLKYLQEMQQNDRASYEKFWQNFGPTLKEGIPSDPSQNEKLQPLLLARSHTRDGWVTLDEYVESMPESQTEIYYLTGDSLEQLRNSPYLEKLNKKNYEALLFSDPVDEWVVTHLTEYKGKKLVSIASEDLNLDTEEEKQEKEKQKQEAEEKLGGLRERIQNALNDRVKEVRFSDRLIDAPVCLVAGRQDPSARMERLMQAMGQEMPKSKRIMEINPNHSIFEKMKSFPENEQNEWAELLYNQALLNEGSALENPVKFSQQVSRLMAEYPQ